MRALVIVGAGGVARETLDIVEALNAVERHTILPATEFVVGSRSGTDLLSATGERRPKRSG